MQWVSRVSYRLDEVIEREPRSSEVRIRVEAMALIVLKSCFGKDNIWKIPVFLRAWDMKPRVLLTLLVRMLEGLAKVIV